MNTFDVEYQADTLSQISDSDELMIPLIYHDIYSNLPLPEGHRYPINKYRLLFDEISCLCDTQESWSPFKFFTPEALTKQEVKQTHASDYVDALVSGSLEAAKMRRIGFPWSEQLITRTLTSGGGTVLTAEMALQHGVAIHLSGGYHHAHRDYGSGFCLFNDLVLAAKRALTHDDIDKVLIVDSDVHHGDGTATLCEGSDEIITLSFHCDKNFPARKPSSDVDIPLPRETDDKTFLESFQSVVETAINLYSPDLIIYDAGVDIHTDDELGYFNVSTEAIYQRDSFMFQIAKAKSIPIGCVVGGGYRSEHAALVPIHQQLFIAALEQFGD